MCEVSSCQVNQGTRRLWHRLFFPLKTEKICTRLTPRAVQLEGKGQYEQPLIYAYFTNDRLIYAYFTNDRLLIYVYFTKDRLMDA